MPTITRQGRYGVDSVRGGLSHLTLCRWVEIHSRFLWWAAKGLASKWETLPSSSHDCKRPLWRWKCHCLGRNYHDREDRTPHLPGECHWALIQRQFHWDYCCALRSSPWERIHLSRRQCKSPSCTCCPRSPAVRLSHCQRSPKTYLSLNIGNPRETCPETASQAAWHQRARWCTPGAMAPDPPSNQWAAHQEHEDALSREHGGDWRIYWLLRLVWIRYTDPHRVRSQVQVIWLIKNFVVDDKCVV